VNFDPCKNGGSDTLAKGTLHPYKKIGFSRGSQFLDGNSYFESDYAPAFEVFKKKLCILDEKISLSKRGG